MQIEKRRLKKPSLFDFLHESAGGVQRHRRCTGQRGRFSFKREPPPLEPPRERQGAFRFRPLHPLTTKREGRSPSFLDYPPRASDGAALLRSPLWGAAFLAFCWIAIANRFIGDDVL